MDFAVSSGCGTKFKALLVTQGYLPDQFFNGLHGATRLYYEEPGGSWSIDVVIDELVMSHKLDLRGRLEGPEPTVTLADLLLTKLQVWEINRKDLGDALCILSDHALTEDDPDPDGVSLPRVRAVLGKDWGFCHTFERNARKVGELWAQDQPSAPAHDVAEQVSPCCGRSRMRRSRGPGSCGAVSVSACGGTRPPRRSALTVSGVIDDIHDLPPAFADPG